MCYKMAECEKYLSPKELHSVSGKPCLNLHHNYKLDIKIVTEQAVATLEYKEFIEGEYYSHDSSVYR